MTATASAAPSRRRVAVVDHALSFPPLDVFSAAHKSFELVWVVGPGAATDARSNRLRERTGTVVTIGSELGRTCSELRHLGVQGVVTFADENYMLTTQIVERLGLPGHSHETARTLSSKVRQRRAFEHAGLPGPRYCHLDVHNPGPGLEAARELDMPVVVKPDLGSASRGIQLVRDQDELSHLLSSLSTDAVAEELVPDGIRGAWYASYLSVESLVHAGSITHVALTGRFPLAARFRETGNFLPALISESARPEVLDLATRAISATGITDSAVHTEIKMAPNGPQLIEINGRLAGRPVYLLREVSEVDLFEETLEVATGKPPSPTGIVACSAVAYWIMLQPPETATHLEGIKGLDDCADLPGVTSVDLHLRPDDPVPHHLGTLSRVVSIRGTARDHATVAATAAAARDLLQATYLHEPLVRRPESYVVGDGRPEGAEWN